MICTGQHVPPADPCVDCAIARCRARNRRDAEGELVGPVMVKRSCWPRAEHWPRNHEAMWRIIATFAQIVRDQHRARWRAELKQRWKALPPAARAEGRDVVAAFADDLVVIERLIDHLEGDGWRSAA